MQLSFRDNGFEYVVSRRAAMAALSVCAGPNEGAKLNEPGLAIEASDCQDNSAISSGLGNQPCSFRLIVLRVIELGAQWRGNGSEMRAFVRV